MVTYTYSMLQNVLNIDTDDVTAANTENLIDQAIHLLNLAGAHVANDRSVSYTDITNLSGTAGSKTVTLTSAQAGAVTEVAKAVYYRDYREQVPVTLGELGAQVAATPEPWALAVEMALGLIASASTNRDFLLVQ
jgi:hypothetical protein